MTQVRLYMCACEYLNVLFLSICIGTTLETRDVANPVLSGSDGLLQSLKTPKAVSKELVCEIQYYILKHSKNTVFLTFTVTLTPAVAEPSLAMCRCQTVVV